MIDHLKFRSSLTARGHAAIRSATEHLSDDTPHEAVNDDILWDPAIWRAVHAVIGPNALADACRHVHTNTADQHGDWHIDDYCGKPWPADSQFAILCYFPQDTPPQLGPTQIRLDGREILGGGPAGSCLLMREHVEHRSTANISGQPRIMLKYLFRAER
jgi:hypothetical protein